MIQLSTAVITTFVLFPTISIAYSFLRKSPRRRLPYPPGPRPLPLLGNLLDMPKQREYETYTEWGKKYGDVAHVKVLGQHIIILNSIEAANDLLDTRSYKYSSRPYIPMVHEPDLMAVGWVLTFKPYGEEWKRHRRLFVQHLGAQAIPTFQDKLLGSAHTLLRGLLLPSSPEEIDKQIRHLVADMMMKITYGYDVKGRDDPFIGLLKRLALEVVEGMNPVQYLVNTFPWLKHIPDGFPGSGFKQFAKKVKKTVHDTLNLPFEDMKIRLEAGTVTSSFASNALSEMDTANAEYERDIMEVSGSMFGAGFDTTSSLVYAGILALVLNPEVQRRAQIELDALLGSPDSPTFRLPTFKDRPHLPYITAIMKELMRWWLPLPLGIAHTTTDDDEYRGWHIPKGSIILANSWAILHDEKLYPEPWKFNPDRFMEDKATEVQPDPIAIGCFGFGRRICPGIPLVEAWVWIEIASLLAAFDFSPDKDENGNDIDVSYAVTPDNDFILHPQFFPCKITPRSNFTVARIQETEEI